MASSHCPYCHSHNVIGGTCHTPAQSRRCIYMAGSPEPNVTYGAIADRLRSWRTGRYDATAPNPATTPTPDVGNRLHIPTDTRLERVAKDAARAENEDKAAVTVLMPDHPRLKLAKLRQHARGVINELRTAIGYNTQDRIKWRHEARAVFREIWPTLSDKTLFGDTPRTYEDTLINFEKLMDAANQLYFVWDAEKDMYERLSHAMHAPETVGMQDQLTGVYADEAPRPAADKIVALLTHKYQQPHVKLARQRVAAKAAIAKLKKYDPATCIRAEWSVPYSDAGTAFRAIWPARDTAEMFQFGAQMDRQKTIANFERLLAEAERLYFVLENGEFQRRMTYPVHPTATEAEKQHNHEGMVKIVTGGVFEPTWEEKAAKEQTDLRQPSPHNEEYWSENHPAMAEARKREAEGKSKILFGNWEMQDGVQPAPSMPEHQKIEMDYDAKLDVMKDQLHDVKNQLHAAQKSNEKKNGFLKEGDAKIAELKDRLAKAHVTADSKFHFINELTEKQNNLRDALEAASNETQRLAKERDSLEHAYNGSNKYIQELTRGLDNQGRELRQEREMLADARQQILKLEKETPTEIAGLQLYIVAIKKENALRAEEKYNLEQKLGTIIGDRDRAVEALNETRSELIKVKAQLEDFRTGLQAVSKLCKGMAIHEHERDKNGSDTTVS